MSEPSNRIVVTGGCGYVGARLTRDLVRRGHRVTVIDDLSAGRSTSLGPEVGEVDLCVADLRDESAVTRCLAARRPDAVLHLAALHFIPTCEADPARTIETNVHGTYRLLRACRAVPSTPWPRMPEPRVEQALRRRVRGVRHRQCDGGVSRQVNRRGPRVPSRS